MIIKYVILILKLKFLDCALTFSENGRNFSIIYSLVGAANLDIKRTFGIP